MPEPTPTGTRRIELFVREGLPEPTRERERTLRAAVEELAETGTVTSFSITSCEKRSRIDSRADDLPYVSFREWAGRADVTLSPFFDTRTCYSERTGLRHQYRVHPAFCLAVYDDDELTAVYPHRGDQPRSVMDGLAALRRISEEVPTPSRPRGSSAAD